MFSGREFQVLHRKCYLPPSICARKLLSLIRINELNIIIFVLYYLTVLISIIIKFRYNARSDWLKERALSEYRARSDEGGPISVFTSAF